MNLQFGFLIFISALLSFHTSHTVFAQSNQTSICTPEHNSQNILIQDQYSQHKPDEAALWENYNSWTWKNVYCTTQKQGERYELLVNEFRNEIHIDMNATNIWSASHLHKALKKALNLPSTYGKNFDALYDALTDVQTYRHPSEESSTKIVGKRIYLHISGTGLWEKQIGKKNVKRFLKTLQDAVETNNSSTPQKDNSLCANVDANVFDPQSPCDTRYKFNFSWYQ